ncbi:MAG: hypothetical protein FWH41_02860 [Treponema sp.]|nr:hypothetical protein [Treponema sp.]
MTGEKTNNGGVYKEKPVMNEKSKFRFLDDDLETIIDIKPVNKKPEAGKAAGLSKKHKLFENKHLKEGLRLFRIKRWEHAQKEFSQIKADSFTAEEQAELAYYNGLCCTKLAQYDDAILYLEQVITTGSDALRSYQCRMAIAYIYLITNRSRMAEFELTRLLNNGFESTALYNSLAFSAYIQKRYKQAITLYEKSLSLDNGNATALNSIGYILADTGIDRTRGLQFCRKAVEIQPRNAAYLDSLGWAFYKCGETAQARNWLKQALDAAPHEKEIKNHFRIVTEG